MSVVQVKPRHWGRGGGRLLMDAGLVELAKAGYREPRLWALDTNQPARRFYEAGGWRADGMTKTDDSLGFPLVEMHYRRALAP